MLPIQTELPSFPFRLLALDCATSQMAVALADGTALAHVDAPGGAEASARLLPEVLALLAARSLRPADLAAIAFGQGPGAFTGLRTAAAVAQGLAFAIGCPVLPIDSLLIVAEDARLSGEAASAGPWDVWVAMDARMDEIYAAHYLYSGKSEARWQVLRAPALYDVPTLAAVWHAWPPRAAAGSALEAFRGRLPLAAAQTFPQTAQRAAALLRLAQAAWQAGAGQPPEQALPLYLRDKVALTTAERAAAGQPK